MTDAGADAHLILHQLFSPAFPTGGFAYSHGLEALVAEGRVTSAADTADWLDAVLTHGSGWSDAVLFAHAARGEEPVALSDLAAAMAQSRARRAETLRQGAAFAGTCRAVWSLDLSDLALPVAAGRAVHLMGLPVGAALPLYLSGLVATLASAAVRLVPLGQSAGQAVIAGRIALCADVAARAERAPLDEIGGFAPIIDAAAARQEALPVRLFQS
ncbi:urease accessory protein UreF [Roseivivax marinus]|uniref:urease accessory protein UreF n=1 Tax=Roseivivax marinus TaxID=1379903 RepID=UPI001F03B23A|nr:urease accessory UreF family protein [Roseivivax marinus]UMA65249.1 urease accessory protein UreF [Roseivivax marinus]